MLTVVDKSRQLPWITGLFGVVVLLLALLPESSLSVVQYDREKILDGELWRMFTGHLVHWNSTHLIWDLLVFFACGGLLEWLRRNLLVSVLIGGSFVVSGALLVFQPDMHTYRGLSALDMGLFSALCLQAISYCWFRNKKSLAIIWSLVLLGCFLKPLLEVSLGSAMFVPGFGPGVEASPESHVYGILVALILFTGTSFWRKLSSRPGCNHKLRTHKLSETSIS